MSEPNFPTILYPNGGEVILGYEITIQWQIPAPLSYDSRGIVYELYYTDQYDSRKEPDWKQIATLAPTVFQYVWRFGNAIRSDKCRIGIRSRNARGERSRMAVSAGTFSIHRKKLEAPTLIAPTSGRFDKFIDIITDDTGIVGSYSERSFYQFFYSSDSLSIPPTIVAQNVPVNNGSIRWNTVNLPPANDYVIHSYLSDDDGNQSDTVFVKNIEIAHEGFFVIDTVPPESSIVINGNNPFTKDRDVTVTIVSYDDATAVHSMQLSDGSTKGDPSPIADIASYKLSDGDAIKTVQLLLQDFGANRNNLKPQRLFETVVEVDNGVKVADIALDRSSGTAWAITSSPSNYLYKIQSFPSLVTVFEDEPTSVMVFGSFVYVSVKTADNLSVLMSYNGYESVAVKAFTEADSVVNAMVVHNGDMFLGLENGLVYQFDGLTFTKLNGVANPVKNLVSDGSLLYLTERSGTEVYIFNGTDFVSTGA